MQFDTIIHDKHDSSVKIVSHIQQQAIAELKAEYPEYIQDTDISLLSVLAKINAFTRQRLPSLLMNGIACSERIKIMKAPKGLY